MPNIEIIEPKLNQDYYRKMTLNAFYVLQRTRKGRKELEDFADVISGLCRQAYLKGQSDLRKELNV